MMKPGTPPAELEIDAALVRRLLAAQHPDLAALPLGATQEGWDNVTMRLGPDLAVRLPRRRAAADLLRREQIWLPRLAPSLPVAVPVARRIGLPAADYPWHWSVLPWLKGGTADRAVPAPKEALYLATNLQALHHPAPED
ncbi:phosphotransferase, partial [Thioclava sp. BHET1]